MDNERLGGDLASDGHPIDAWLAPLTLRDTDLGDVPSTTTYRASDKGLLPVSLRHYAAMLDYARKQKRSTKQRPIPPELASVLEQVGLKEQDLAETVDNFPTLFRRIAGTANHMIDRAKQVGRKWFQGIRSARKIFTEPAESG